ncbi:hypothetical protein IW492_05085 [Enterococcus sp. BWB1-3]|uniref:hypothetical protein n=1 Tax=Enterococcus sp. BWB1-3 TaxID=2787713 RepID=UPI001921060A|nr:hypothetical protein [Enterococcus sp. BWB1-3]MBL1228607.1 hypothetical protein [Enterococcus sp. BWB1-3]
MYNNDENSTMPVGPLSLGIEAVYYSSDIEKTLHWFDTFLGWLTKVEKRDASGLAAYGLAYTIPFQYFYDRSQKSVKIHIFKGEPRKELVSIIPTIKLDKLVAFVNKASNNTPCVIKRTDDGINYVELTTVDGSILTFYQKSSKSNFDS